MVSNPAAAEAVPWQTHHWKGRRIAWRRVGSGPPLVLCHGTPWSSWVWDGLAGRLASSRTVYLWDMPGYGRSSMDPRHPVDLGVQGRALAALLRHWGLTEPDVVGHDVGGAVALRAHLLHGARYRSLVLADAVTLRPWGSDFFRLVAAHGDVFARLPAAIHRGLVEAYLADASHAGLTPDTLLSLAAPWLTPEGQAAFYRQIVEADPRFTDDVAERLTQIRVPTLVVWGENDAWLPVEQAHRLAAQIPGAICRLIPQAGHLVQLDNLPALAAALHWWLRGRCRGA